MYTYTLVRDNEKILINDYNFEWYVDNKLRRSGLVIDVKQDIKILIEEGFELID